MAYLPRNSDLDQGQVQAYPTNNNQYPSGRVNYLQQQDQNVRGNSNQRRSPSKNN